MEKASRYSYTETLERLSNAIRAGGNTIFATIDQSAAATGVGMTLRPTSLIVFGNPRGGTPLMDAFPEFALELPLKLLVWEDNGTTKVAHPRMSDLAARYGVTGKDQVISAMDRALEALAASVS
ncbi:MAG TPA: DUF302 domain-containing protein [Candidatus Acidoferrales bacterium]|nr:DUF302 domain-containing protein [Candidatus Acidoferrales bacterium]